MESIEQLQLPLGNPDGFEGLERYEGRWINDYVKLLSAPWFHWPTGQWRALANVDNMLCIVIVLVQKESR